MQLGILKVFYIQNESITCKQLRNVTFTAGQIAQYPNLNEQIIIAFTNLFSQFIVVTSYIQRRCVQRRTPSIELPLVVLTFYIHFLL